MCIIHGSTVMQQLALFENALPLRALLQSAENELKRTLEASLAIQLEY
jgi:hypothetical protein